jgi:GNAT superfamily N-acetyltransferase
MADLDIRFIPYLELTPVLQSQFDELDHLAFGGMNEEEDPEFSTIQWATPDWMALGFLQGQLVTQLCIPKRQITVGTERVWVAGLGGMATHPEFQPQGLGSTLLAATEAFMRDTIQVPFGLLICAEGTRPFYEHSRWQFAANSLYFTQEDQRRIMNPCVMILPLTDRLWPPGEIDLCGLPW